MRGKISAASFWFHKPRIQVDLLDLVFLDGCDKSLYVPIPRFCTAPFVLTKNLLWDTRILAHKWKTYGQAEIAIGVRASCHRFLHFIHLLQLAMELFWGVG